MFKSSYRTPYLLHWIGLGIAVILPTLIVVTWHYFNVVVPNDDAGCYFQTAYRIYNSFLDHGLLKGLHAIYFERGWRPVFLPVLTLPFIIFCKGNVIASTASALVFFYGLFLAYLYLFIRQFLSPLKSCAAAILIGTSSWLISFAFHFMSEMPLLACSAASVYHLYKAQYFTVKKHSVLAAVWLALSFTIRPVEAFFSFLFPLIFLIGKSTYEKHIGKTDHFLTAPFAFLSTILMVLGIKYHMNNEWAGGLTLAVFITHMLVLFFSIKKKVRFHSAYISFFVIFHSAVILWWMPKMKSFYKWVQTCTGVLGLYHHDKGQIGFFNIILLVFRELGGYPFLGLLILFLVACGVSRKKSQPVMIAYLKSFGFAMLMLIGPAFMLSLTTDVTARRLFLGFLAVFVVQSIFTLHPDLKASKLRTAIVFSLALLQWSSSAFGVIQKYPIFYQKTQPYFGGVELPMRGSDPSTQTINQLNNLALKNCDVCVFSLSLYDYTSRPFDAGGLNVMSEAKKMNLHFGYPDLFPSLEEGYKEILRQCPYVLLDISNDHYGRANPSPYEKLTMNMIERWKQSDNLKDVSLQELSRFEVQTSHYKDVPVQIKKIILFKAKKAEHS